MAEPQTIIITVKNRNGLHARPASLFVQTSNKFTCDIQVRCNGVTVSGKNILGIMTLGAAAGTALAITATGDDASQALQTLEELVNNNFGEEQ